MTKHMKRKKIQQKKNKLKESTNQIKVNSRKITKKKSKYLNSIMALYVLDQFKNSNPNQ